MEIYLYVFVGLFCVTSFYVGFVSRNVSQNFDHYFLGDRSLGLSSLVLTLLATHIGGGSIIDILRVLRDLRGEEYR